MQKLQFESSWAQTISSRDQTDIQHFFHQIDEYDSNAALLLSETNIKLLPFWQAKNHQDELLISAFIVNDSQDRLTIVNEMIKYYRFNQEIAKQVFTISKLVIPPKTTLPWTFIFPKQTVCSSADIPKERIVVFHF